MTWSTHHCRSFAIHTFTAPEAGWFVNSHVVEFPSQIFIVDAQYTLPLAKEVARYAAGVGKPVHRLYVTHYHPDHLLGAAAIDAPIYALQQVAERIAAAGNRVASEEHDKVGDDVAPTARAVDRVFPEGEEMVDGIRIHHLRVRGGETQDALALAFPDDGAIIVQDLIYNRVHVFLGERNFDTWRADLQEYREKPYAAVFPGHGAPGGVELYDRMTEYLDFAENALRSAGNANRFKEQLLSRFADYGGLKILDHQLRFLFPK
jgi:glyoxylase-like metal-dependent hydrolase (beta-lactamase superfamily II)